MTKELLNLVEDASYRKKINLEKIEVYKRTWGDGSGAELIVVNGTYEFHMVGGWTNLRSCFSKKGSLVKLNKDDVKGIKNGFYETKILNKTSKAVFTKLEEICF